MTLVVVVGLGHSPGRPITPWFMSQRTNLTVSVMYRYRQWQVLIHHTLIYTALRMSSDAGESIVYGLKFYFEDCIWSRTVTDLGR